MAKEEDEVLRMLCAAGLAVMEMTGCSMQETEDLVFLWLKQECPVKAALDALEAVAA